MTACTITESSAIDIERFSLGLIERDVFNPSGDHLILGGEEFSEDQVLAMLLGWIGCPEGNLSIAKKETTRIIQGVNEDEDWKVDEDQEYIKRPEIRLWINRTGGMLHLAADVGGMRVENGGQYRRWWYFDKIFHKHIKPFLLEHGIDYETDRFYHKSIENLGLYDHYREYIKDNVVKKENHIFFELGLHGKTCSVCHNELLSKSIMDRVKNSKANKTRVSDDLKKLVASNQNYCVMLPKKDKEYQDAFNYYLHQAPYMRGSVPKSLASKTRKSFKELDIPSDYMMDTSDWRPSFEHIIDEKRLQKAGFTPNFASNLRVIPNYYNSILPAWINASSGFEKLRQYVKDDLIPQREVVRQLYEIRASLEDEFKACPTPKKEKLINELMEVIENCCDAFY